MKEKRYFLDRRSFSLKAALVCLLAAFLLRGVSGLLNRVVLEDRLTLLSFLTFLGSCLLYALSLVLFGKKWLWLTTGTFILGIMAFVSRLFTFDNLLQEEVSIQRMMVSIFYYLVVTAVYAGTVCGGLRGKWFLVPLFVIPLAGHITFDIVPAFQQGVGLSAAQITAELSVLFVITGMIFTALAMRRVGREYTDEMKEQKVIPPLPGNKLDEKPPAVSDPVQVELGAESISVEPKMDFQTESSSSAEEKLISDAKEETIDVNDKEEYDPFAPSSEPICLTLDPFMGDDNSEPDSKKTEFVQSDEKKEEHIQP